MDDGFAEFMMGLVIGFVLMAIFAIPITINSCHKGAVEAGAAEYYISDEATGETSFRYLKCEGEEE